MRNEHEAFFKQLEGFRRYLLKESDVSAAEAEIIPEGFNNNIRWNVGHVYTEQYMWIKTLMNEDVDIDKRFDDWFGFATSPKNFTAETPSLEELRTLLSSQIGHIKETYGERLEEEFSPTELWGLTTLKQVLDWTSFHEGMHLQTIKHLKNFIRG